MFSAFLFSIKKSELAQLTFYKTVISYRIGDFLIPMSWSLPYTYRKHKIYWTNRLNEIIFLHNLRLERILYHFSFTYVKNLVFIVYDKSIPYTLLSQNITNEIDVIREIQTHTRIEIFFALKLNEFIFRFHHRVSQMEHLQFFSNIINIQLLRVIYI